MKKQILLILVSVFLFSINANAQLFKRKSTIEKVETKCEGLQLSERPLITVSQFKVTARKANRHFGAELSTMLSNALVETGCFNVLSGDMSDMVGELKIGQTYGNSNPELTQVKTAQYFVTGEITEFDEKIFKGVRVLGTKIGADRAHIGLILQIKNAQREIIFSKSIDKKRTKPSTGKGLSVFGVPIATTSFKSQAMADALEKGIIEAVEILVKQKGELEMTAPEKLEPTIVYSRANCSILASGNAPKVMVIIPEVHIQRRIPDPAGETEIIKKLTNAGFPVVDPTMYMALRNDGNLSAIIKNPVQAANIGAEYGADIIIIGEAFSQSTGRTNGMTSCRARVEARAIETKTGLIIGADGKHGTGLDIAEMVSAKTALRNAGASMGDFFLSKFCNSDMQTSLTNKGSSSTFLTRITLKNADFKTLSNISNFLKRREGISNVSKKLVRQEGIITFETENSMDELADALMSGSIGGQIGIEEFSDNKLVLRKK